MAVITSQKHYRGGKRVAVPRWYRERLWRNESLGAPTTATTLNEVLLWHAKRHPDVTHALVIDENQAVTYAQLRDRAQEVAGALQQAVVQPGATLALLLPTAAEYLYTFFDVLLAGAVPETPLDLPEPHVVVANHCSYLDSVFVAALLPGPHIVVANAELQRIPVLGAYLRSLGIIFVERSTAVKRVREVPQMTSALAAGPKWSTLRCMR